MASWSNRELAEILGGPVDGIAVADLQRLVDQAEDESEILDFKVEFDPSSIRSGGFTAEQEFAKDVAAFANARGGLIVFGIKDRDGSARELRAISGTTPEQHERRLRQALRNHMSPLADVQMSVVLEPAGGFYHLIAVPPSNDGPHAVTTPPGIDKRAFWFPRRHGADTVYMREHETALMYRRRFDSLEDRRRARSSLIDQGLVVLKSSPDVWLWVAVFPDRPRLGVLDNAMAELIDGWWNGGLGTPLGRHYERGLPLPGPGKQTFPDFLRHGDEELDPRSRYFEFHVDGSALGASALSFHTTDEHRDEKPIGEFTLVDDAIALVDAAVRWTAHRVGTFGTATVSFGLVDHGADGRSIEIVNDDYDRLRRMRLTRRHLSPLDLRGETTVDLAVLETMQERLVVTHQVLSGILQWFGRAEPDQLSSDGALVLHQWRIRDRRQIDSWIDQHKVPTT